MPTYWQVAVDVPMHQALTYTASEELGAQLVRGQFVKVPLGARSVNGLIVNSKSEYSGEFELKDISAIQPEYPVLDERFVKWLEWVASYYFYPIGWVTKLALPALEKRESNRASNRAPVVPIRERSQAMLLTPDQQNAFEQIEKHKDFSTHLLFGITGSGKTEVYLQLLHGVLESGKNGLVLVPEISLTPQLVNRFAERFGDQISVIHSQLTDRERTNQWWDIVSGKKRILIGARSALFCPIQNLGLIVVDEEHEPSYKQDEKLKYNGRDSAIVLARFHNCPIVLGSATPSLETWKNVQDGKYHMHKLANRVANRALPQVEVVDLRKMEKGTNIPYWMSEQLFTALTETLERKDQAALFLNRRGVANIVLCPDCGYTYECPNCDVTLTLHGQNHLVCHYCDYHESMKIECPSCKVGQISQMGLGTELLEKDIHQLFPQARIARADRDEIQNRQDMEELISQMESGEIDVLIGTQMIAKGLDFPKLNLVGLVLADVGFNFPDFRATERSFQLITQVSGRAGRHVKPGDPPGRVIIQTYNPDHPCLGFSANDFEGFANFELTQRAPLAYPPIGKLISLRIQGTQLPRVSEAARLLSDRSRQLKTRSQNYETIEVLGPAEAPLAKLRGNYRYHLLLKGLDHKLLNAFCHQILGDQAWVPSGVKISVDVDPLHLL